MLDQKECTCGVESITGSDHDVTCPRRAQWTVLISTKKSSIQKGKKSIYNGFIMR